MKAVEQYRDFHEWLRAKYGECCCEWKAADIPEVRAKYEALLQRIATDADWVFGKFMLDELEKNARKLQEIVK